MVFDIAAREQRSAEKKKTGFEKWLDEPMVRMGMSIIPAGERPESLKLLLQSAFDAGYGVGVGDVLFDMIENIVTKKGEPPVR
jgi:hypothetical protein